LDEGYISVKKFGAKGDGVTDDTDAINRAFYQIYCRGTNVQVRRILYFPAGMYIISSGFLKIPPFATIVGDGMDNSIIKQIDATQSYVAKFTNSRQQSGTSYTTNNAKHSQYISVTDITFENSINTGVIFAESSGHVSFVRTKFQGSLSNPKFVSAVTATAITLSNNSASVDSYKWLFESCSFSNLDYGFLSNDNTSHVTFANCSFTQLVKGIVLGVTLSGANAVGPSHYKIIGNDFDKISSYAIQVENGRKILSEGNSFKDVGNSQQGAGLPVIENIKFRGTTGISSNDVFDRTINQTALVPWVDYGPSLGNEIGFSSTNNLVTSYGFTKILYNNALYPSATGIEIPKLAQGFEFVYTISRQLSSRKGRLTAAGFECADEFSETSPIGVTFSVGETTSKLNYTIKYTMTNSIPSEDAVLTGYIQYSIVPPLPSARFNLAVESVTGFVWTIPAKI
jgi:hypothetical protein